MAQKVFNQQLARRRVRIEHVNSSVKRCRIVKDTIRLFRERNPYRPLSTTTLDKLAKALEVDASVLIESMPDDEKEAQ
ncbi:MAG: hypothetical protein ACJ788_22365 [Ktedonobacteraceae bacterium]